MEAAILARLSGDSTFMGYLSGGFFNSLEHEQVSVEHTPTAFDAYGEIDPTAFVKFENDSPTPTALSRDEKVYRFIFSIMFYSRVGAGATAIRSAKDRAFALLDGWKPAAVWDTTHAGDIPDTGNQALLGSLLFLSRYVILRRRS